MRKKLFLGSLFWCSFIMNVGAQEGFIAVPVADLLGQSMESIITAGTKRSSVDAHEIIERYHTIPATTAETDLTTCPRIYQLLFNERVLVLDEQGPELKIEVPYALYGHKARSTLSGTYWTLKKNILTHDAVGKTLFQQAVPEMIGTAKSKQQKTVVLKNSWYDRSTRRSYSAGTRFILYRITPKKNFEVFIYDPASKKRVTTIVPQSRVLVTGQTPDQLQGQYVDLLKEWARASAQDTLAYVLGGASFAPSTSQLHSGFDCSGLIIRAAQSCSIPFYLKNSSAQMHHLEELGTNKIRNGDILWFAGHVIVLSDRKNHSIIESRGYTSGYGRLHELPIAKVFKDVMTFDDLEKKYQARQPLQLLKSEGQSHVSIPTYKILRFSSVWHTHTKHTPSSS